MVRSAPRTASRPVVAGATAVACGLVAVVMVLGPVAYLGVTVWTFTGGARAVATVTDCRSSTGDKGATTTTCTAVWTDAAGRRHRADGLPGLRGSDEHRTVPVRSGPLGDYADRTDVWLPRVLLSALITAVVLGGFGIAARVVVRNARAARRLRDSDSAEGRLLTVARTGVTEGGALLLAVEWEGTETARLSTADGRRPVAGLCARPGSPPQVVLTGSAGEELGRIERASHGPPPSGLLIVLRDADGTPLAWAPVPTLGGGFQFTDPDGTPVAVTAQHGRAHEVSMPPFADRRLELLLCGWALFTPWLLAEPPRRGR